jgi:hypothetical protein
MTKYETIGVAIDHKAVSGTKLYDLKVIELHQVTNFFSMTKDEVNTVYKAYDILNKRKWGKTGI